MKMTPMAVVIGSLLLLAAIVFMVVYMPWATRIEEPSENTFYRSGLRVCTLCSGHVN
jgi:hypothetical protein